MLKACFLSLGGGGSGTTWVVCAPTEQGKSAAAQFLIHGKHSLLPERSLKIDATNMKDFAKDFAGFLNCSVAEKHMSVLLCGALTANKIYNAPADSGEGKSATETATNFSGQCLCNPGNGVAFSTHIEMRDADEREKKALSLKTLGKEPAPILIIDEFYCDTDKNVEFVRTLLRDASSSGVVVFLMTRDKKWASRLITLNGGAKIKPLPLNVDNAGYSGSKRFEGKPQWNDSFWEVKELRKMVQPLCSESGVKPDDVVPENSRLTPGEARKEVLEKAFSEQLDPS